MSLLCEILMLENSKDIEEFNLMSKGEFNEEEINKIISLRVDFKTN